MKITCQKFILCLGVSVLFLLLPQFGHSEGKKALGPKKENLGIIPHGPNNTAQNLQIEKISLSADSQFVLIKFLRPRPEDDMLQIRIRADYLREIMEGQSPEPDYSREKDANWLLEVFTSDDGSGGEGGGGGEEDEMDGIMIEDE